MCAAAALPFAHTWHKVVAADAPARGQVCPSYPADGAAFPGQLMQLLSEQATVLAPGVRKTLVQALALLRSKEAVAPVPYDRPAAWSHTCARPRLTRAGTACSSSSFSCFGARTRSCGRWCAAEAPFPPCAVQLCH
jgi:hypothetical protein